MKRLALAGAGLFGLAALVLAIVLVWLLNTTAGLRWAVDQALSRTGVPVEIAAVDGRLLGPVSVTGLQYNDPESGARVGIEAARLEWQPGALFSGLFHVTRLRAEGVEYTAGSPGTETQDTTLPRIALPVRVRVDHVEVESVAITQGSGPPFVIERAALRGTLDGESLTLEEVRVDTERYQVADGHATLDLLDPLPIDGSLSWTVDVPDLPAFNGRLRVGGNLLETLEPGIEIDAPFKASGDGTVTGLLDTPRWTLTANIPEPVRLSDVVARWPALSIQGDIKSEGDTGSARLQPEVAVSFNDMAANLQGDALVSPDEVVIDNARLERRDAPDTVTFSGRLGFGEALPFDIAGRWESLHGPEAAAWSSRSGEFDASGDRTELTAAISGVVTPPGESEESPLDIDLRGANLDAEPVVTGSVKAPYFTVGEIRADTLNADVDLRAADREFSSLSGTATVGARQLAYGDIEAGELNVDVDMRTAGREFSDLSGTATLSARQLAYGDIQAGELSTDVDIDLPGRDVSQLSVTGTLSAADFSSDDIQASDLDAEIDLRAGGSEASRLSVTAASAQIGERRLSELNVAASGTRAQHEVSIAGRVDDWSIRAQAGGSYTEPDWRGSVDQLTVESGFETLPGRWELEQPADMTWTASGGEVESLCLRHDGAKLCAGGSYAPSGDWDADARVDAFPLKWLARDASESVRVEGTITASATAASRSESISAEAEARIDEADITWLSGEPITTRYRDLAFTGTLTPEELHLQLDGAMDESGTIHGELTTRDPLAADGAIEGNISVSLPSLRLVQAAVPALGLEQGSADVSLAVEGTRKAPRFTGDGRIDNAALNVAALGIRLESINVRIDGEDRGLDLAAQAASGDGTLSAEGRIRWPEDGWRAEVTVTGQDAELVRLPSALIDGNPDLALTVNQTGGSVNGSILLTRAELTPDAGRPQVTLSDDIVVIGDDAAQEATRNPMAWHASVSIDFGDDTTFDGYGVEANLTGSLDVEAPPRQPMRANGAIEIHDGEYSIYGRTFDIERGRLVYAGGPIDNPGMDIQVGREVGEVSVELLVTGPLTDPQLSVSSTPAMSDTDRMSYLLLGRPAAEASGAEAGLLLRAAASLIPGGGRGVPDRIQSTLGLDTLELRAESPETEGAAVELGKYVAPNLYVSYIAGFQESVDIFRVRYELARHWLLRAESSTRGSGGDLLFTW